jgi:hypothetical protein
MAAQEPHHLTADLQARQIRIQVQPIDTTHLERHMTSSTSLMFATLAIPAA